MPLSYPGLDVIHATVRIYRPLDTVRTLPPTTSPESPLPTLLSLRTLSLSVTGDHPTIDLDSVFRRAPNLRAIQLGWEQADQFYRAYDEERLKEAENPGSEHGMKSLKLIRVLLHDFDTQRGETVLVLTSAFAKRWPSVRIEWWMITSWTRGRRLDELRKRLRSYVDSDIYTFNPKDDLTPLLSSLMWTEGD